MLSCTKIIYENRKTYNINELDPIGIYFNLNINDTINYGYEPKYLRYYLVKVLGDIVYDKDNNIITKKIKILKELSNIDIINLDNNYIYLIHFIMNKLLNNENERELDFNKLIANENIYDDLYYLIDDKIYINEKELNMIIDKVKEL